MSTAIPPKPEVLLARTQLWHRRLWVRIVPVLLLGYFVGLVSWWIPRRAMVEVWRVNGRAYSEASGTRATQLLD